MTASIGPQVLRGPTALLVGVAVLVGGLGYVRADTGGAPRLAGGSFESGAGAVGSADFGVTTSTGVLAAGQLAGGGVSVDAGSVQAADACPLVPGLGDRQGCDLAVAASVRLHIQDSTTAACLQRTGAIASSCFVTVSGARVKVYDRNRLKGLVLVTASGRMTLSSTPKKDQYDEIFASPEAESARVAALGCVTDDSGCLAGTTTLKDLLVISRWDPPNATPIYSGRVLGAGDTDGTDGELNQDTDGDGDIDLASVRLTFVERHLKNGSVQYSGE